MRNLIAILLAVAIYIPVFGQSDLVSGEYFWNTDPGIGQATSITVTTPNDTLDQTVTVTAPVDLPKGQNALFIRYKDDNGVWGMTKVRYFINNVGLDLVSGEYFWGEDPGLGQGTPFTVTSPADPIDESITVNVPADIGSGGHALYMRIQDEEGTWSMPKARYFISTSQIPITHIEYYWDTDPGFGLATSIPLGQPSTMIDESAVLDVSALTIGPHTLVVRVKDEDNVWSIIKSEKILIASPIYVDESATGTNTGADWTNAFPTLIEALDSTVDSLAYKIRVAEGTYVSDEGTGDRDSSFVIKSNTTILGGYPSGGDTDENRDADIYETILSGDIGIADDSTDNSYHVIVTNGVSDVTVDGVSINDGYADGGNELSKGAGWYNVSTTIESSPNIVNCNFKNNYSALWGTAFFNRADGSGAIANPVVDNCSFENNIGVLHAGGVFNYAKNTGTANVNILNTKFIDNDNQTNYGGAIFNLGENAAASMEVVNSIFTDCDGPNGGAGCNRGGVLDFINCSFANNSSGNGEHLYNYNNGNPTTTNIVNCIFSDTGNNGDIFSISGGTTMNLSYSLIDGPLPTGATDNGNNILDTDPLYIDPANGDLHISVNSPAANQGDNSANSEPFDLGGNDRIQNSVIDLGAYEILTDSCLIDFQAYSSCAGGFDLVAGDSIITEFTAFNGAGPYDISLNGVVYTGLQSGDTIAVLNEGIDFNGNPPYTFTLELESVSDQGNGCALNPDTTAYVFNIQEAATLSVDDTDNTFCDGQTVTFSVLPATLGAYDFFNDLNSNGIKETGEELQSGASNLYSFITDISNPVLNITCIAGSSSCVSTTNTIASTVVANPTAQISISENSGSTADDGNLCFGGLLTMTASGGSSYIWDDNSTDALRAVSVIPQALYTVTVTSADGCTDNEDYLPQVDEEISIAVNDVNDISCFGEVDGSIDVTASGGAGGFNYDIGGAALTVGLFESLAAGDYTVIVVDLNLCDANETYTIAEPDELVSSPTVVDEQCYQDSTGSIQIAVSGGTSPFTYDIGNGTQSSSTFSSLTIGNYQVITSDASGCKDTVSADVFGFDSLDISIVSISNAMCSSGSSDGSATFAAAGGAGNYTYSIGGGFQASPTFSGLSADDYVLTVKDDNDCEKTLDFTVGSQSLSATFTYSDNENYVNKVVTPESGSQYETYRFEINFVDPNNELPAASYPRLFLDYEGNGIYTNSNDRIYILSQSDDNDTDVTDGKVYYAEAIGLPVSSDWKAYFIALDANGCEATFGPMDVPDVLANPNVSIFASNISFSESNPDTSEFFNVFADIHNTSSFDAVDFEVALLNQYSDTYEDTLTISLLEAGETVSVFWDVQAPAEDAWVPYKVEVDVNNDIDESNELDNSASKAVIVGDFSLPVEIIFSDGPDLNPQSGYPCTNRTLTGTLVYTGVPGLQDSTVKGAEVTVSFDATGETFTSYTDNAGNFSISIYSPVGIGSYAMSGYVTDQNLTAIFGVPDIIVIPNPPSCTLPDLVLGHTVGKSVVNIGDTLSGTFIVQNVGCAASNDTVLLTANFPDANEVIGPFQVYNLEIGQDTIFSWSVTYMQEQTAQFFAHVDSDLELEELEEGNNYTSRIIAVANKSNLAAPGCQDVSLIPSNPIVGSTAAISFDVSNNSLVDIDEDISYSVVIDGVTYDGMIAGGLSKKSKTTVNQNFTVPAAGNLGFEINVDPEDEIGEKYETDNMYTGQYCSEFSVGERCGGPGVISFWEKTQSLNQFVDFTVGIYNAGIVTGNDVEVVFEIMGPGYSTWTSIGDEMITTLSPTCFCPVPIAPTVPFAFSQEGTYQVRITVDPSDEITECDDTNNVMLQTVTVLNIPDLRVISAYINPTELNPDIGEDITFDISYENIGQENILDTFDLKLSIDGVAIDSQEVYGLAADDFTTVAFTNNWNSTVAGGHVIEAFIDSEEEQVELSETNNQATRAIIVGTAPNLYFVDFKPSDTIPDFGDEILVQAIVGNSGDLDCAATLELFYLDNEGDTIAVGTKQIAVAAGASNQFSISYTVDRAETYILGRITPGVPTEYNLVDNEAVFFLIAGNPPCNLVVTNTNNKGEGSLRQCIECANESDRLKTISFDIPGDGPHTINLLTDLPYVEGDSTNIDGSTQPGNFPMAGEVIIDMTALNGINKTAIIVNAKNTGIYGLRFRNLNLYSKRTAIYYSLGSDSLVIGDSLRGNWFLDDKWESVVYIKENINKGVIQGNVFESDSLRMKHAIFVTPGTNRLTIGGDSIWMRNTFINCTGSAVQLRNHNNDSKIVNNYFEGNGVAIDNTATGFNRGNLYLGNEFHCNDFAIKQNVEGNNGILPPTISYSKVNFVSGLADPGSVIEIYMSPDTCLNSVECQGEIVIFRDTCDLSGEFFYPFDTLLPVGYLISAIQTDTLYSGSSTFSTCVPIDSNCVDFVYSCDDEIIGSLRSAIECAADGDTIYFLTYLSGDDLMLVDTLLIDKDISVYGLGNPGLTVVSSFGDYVMKVAPGKEVTIKDMRICVNDTGAASIIENSGDTTFDNITLIDKRSGQPLPTVVNKAGADFSIKNTLNIEQN